MKNKLCCILFFTVLVFNCFGYPSHHSDGYAIRINNFELFISYDPFFRGSEHYNLLGRTDGMFWNVLIWVYNNKNIFSNINEDIYVRIDYSDNEISIGIDDKWSETKKKYTYKQDTIADIICKAIVLLLNISTAIENDENIYIDVYMVGVYHDHDESLGWTHDVAYESSIFHGSFGSYMVNNREEYFILFWTEESAKNWVENKKIERYNLRKLILSKENIFYELGR